MSEECRGFVKVMLHSTDHKLQKSFLLPESFFQALENVSKTLKIPMDLAVSVLVAFCGELALFDMEEEIINSSGTNKNKEV